MNIGLKTLAAVFALAILFNVAPAAAQSTPETTTPNVAVHPWCHVSPGGQGQVQDWFQFTANGKMSYRRFAFQNGQRVGAPTMAADGDWTLSGQNLSVVVQGQQMAFTVHYNNPDPATNQERFYININGQDTGFDPCN